MPVQGSVEAEEEKKQDETKEAPAKKAEAKEVPVKNETKEAEIKETTDQMNVNLEKESGLVETVLFLESEPLTPEQIASISQLAKDVVDQCLELLKEKYRSENSGIEISMITGGWVLTPKKEFWDVLKERYGDKTAGRLSKSALETLSIIAYKQPITRAEIEALRGVPPDNMIRLLEDRKLVKEVGKRDAPGKPSEFGTTKEFLKFFHLNSIAELPKLDEKESERFELAR
jgi:segregation and condensation protein B